ncbi:hypothetical protein ACIPY5_20045 [Microbacterium sp. NPDC089698]|uniref:hypothetical protein n=1 Tax=Microbacterium sp. NPDC089698 TaxID=3364200 RepID=UPI0037F814F5
MVNNITHNSHPARIAGAARRFWFGRLIAARLSDLLLLAGVALLCAGAYGWGVVVFVVAVVLVFVSRTLRIRAWWFVPWKLQGTDKGPVWVRLLPMLTQLLVLATGAWLMSLSEVGRWFAGPLTAYLLAGLLVFWLWAAFLDRHDRVQWMNVGLAIVLGVIVWGWAVSFVWPIHSVPDWGTAEHLRSVYFGGTAIIAPVTLLLGLLWKWMTHVPTRSRRRVDETHQPAV